MIYFTADQHFGHKNILEFCNRPFSTIEEHDVELIKRWNEVVKDEDHVYVLGDFCYRPGPWCPIVNQLKGTFTFLRGNHDPKKIPRVALANGTILQPSNDVYENNYFVEELVIKFEGQYIRMCHYPYDEDESTSVTLRGAPKRNPRKRDDEILVHGHVHLAWKKKENMINVGVDHWDYKPASLKDVFELFRSK